METPRGVPQLSRTDVRRVAPFLINPLHWEIESSHESLHTNTNISLLDDGRKTNAKDTWWTDMPSCWGFCTLQHAQDQHAQQSVPCLVFLVSGSCTHRCMAHPPSPPFRFWLPVLLQFSRRVDVHPKMKILPVRFLSVVRYRILAQQ